MKSTMESTVKNQKPQIPENKQATCFHCGAVAPNLNIALNEKVFCCNGCLSVYQLLNQVGLCNYYELNEHAGKNQNAATRSDKFSFLDDEAIQDALIQFKGDHQVHITFYIPHIHCSSCIYLLEQFHRIDQGVIRSDVQFLKKEVSIIFDNQKTTLRKIVEQMTAIGYEPHISLQSLKSEKPKLKSNLLYKLGVAGFCFGNIMLMSFPEYFSDNVGETAYIGNIFKYLCFLISLPVFFYSATEFFAPAWKGLKHKHLNIDAPVSLAIIVCFIRSIIDIFFEGGGPGYLDSMSGIVFFMLVGRILQAKTYQQLSFERDYTDYFPIAATKVDQDTTYPVALPNIKVNDTIRIHNQEIIPADGILVRGKALIDYSFVTGESTPIEIQMGSIIYAGGKQLSADMELLVVKEVAKSYLTSLWNKDIKAKHQDEDKEQEYSFIHQLSRYFTYIVLLIATISGSYWWYVDPSKVWHAITAVLIVACPCGLLLTSTFTNGYLLNILDKNGLFLKNAKVIEAIGKINHIVFDKTGTLTSVQDITAYYEGEPLCDKEKSALASLCKPTSHSFSKPIGKYLGNVKVFEVKDFQELAGLGVIGTVRNLELKIGTPTFFQKIKNSAANGTELLLEIDGIYKGRFILQQSVRNGVPTMIKHLVNSQYKLAMISGDGTYQEAYLQSELNNQINLNFNQQPLDKLNYIKDLQKEGDYVGMVGDGLNDAGALQQSNVGICITEDMNNFTPAADAILEATKLSKLDKILSLCGASKKIITTCFIFSSIYNIIGIFFAVQGTMSPIVAAILMPFSTLTIVVLTYSISHYQKRKLGLN